MRFASVNTNGTNSTNATSKNEIPMINEAIIIAHVTYFYQIH